MRCRPLWLLLVGLTACGPSLPDAPVRAVDATFSAAGPLPLEGIDGEADVAAAFTLLPGDVLSVHTVSVDPRESVGLVVDETGHVDVPLAGSVEVGGLSVDEARSSIERAVRAFDRFARVSLHVTDPAGHRVSLTGAVSTPGTFTIRPGMRLAELLASSGGPKVETSGEDMAEVADLEAGRVVRSGDALPVSFEAALRGDPRHNVRLRAGDVVYLPSLRSRRVSVLGLVGRPRTFQFRPGVRLTEALALAGGATKDADGGDIRIVRGALSKPRVYVASLDAIVAGESPDVELAAGDVVFVTEHWLATAGDVMDRLTPLLAAGAVTAALAR